MNKKQEKLPGDYLAGFVDGEGCFALKFRIDRKRNNGNGKFRTYFYWGLEFAIVLRSDEAQIVSQIKDTLDCGKINMVKKGDQIRFSVQNIKDAIEKVIPFFKKYKLRAKKSQDFKLWTKATIIISKYRDGILNTQKGKKGFIKKQISDKDHRDLLEIRDEMINYKSSRSRGFKWGE